jgi:anti-sigma factor RsiW
MKQNRFIELLNLYLDGELPSAAAVELEREILADPARHKIYRQYCQMQRACGLLSERFRDEAAPAKVFRGGDILVPSARPRRTWLQPAAWAASGALAACLAFAVVQLGVASKPTAAVNPPTQTPAVAANVNNVHAPFATPVIASNTPLFRNPWSTRPVFPPRTVGWQQFPAGDRPQTFVGPPLLQLTDPEGNLIVPALPAGDAKDLPTLPREDVQAAAFQFQR